MSVLPDDRSDLLRVHLFYVIDSLAPGGAEQALAVLAPRYISSGIKLDVAYLEEKPGLQSSLEDAGAKLFCVAGPGGRLNRIRRMRRLLAARRPDLVHTTLFEADVTGRAAALLARVPVVSSLVNVEYSPEQLADPRLRRWKVRGAQTIDAVTARAVVRFHALSRSVADTMARRLLIARRRIDVIPRGRDPEKLGTRNEERRRRARASLGLGPSTPLVLAAARHEFQKGLDVLLEAFPTVLGVVPEARLVVAGREGNLTPTLHAAKSRLDLGDAVRFLGVRSDIPELLCAADVVVVPSRWEGLGSVLIEAMALQAPIVASDLPVVREIVDGSMARLVQAADPPALAGGIVETLGDRHAARLGAALAHTRFLERFTLDKVADEMMRFYERALAASSAK